MSFEYLVFSRSFPNTRRTNPIGVKIKKNTKAITKGGTILPRNSPNFNQVLFKGFNNFGWKKVARNKIKEIIIAHVLIGLLLKIGQSPIVKNTKENTKQF